MSQLSINKIWSPWEAEWVQLLQIYGENKQVGWIWYLIKANKSGNQYLDLDWYLQGSSILYQYHPWEVCFLMICNFAIPRGKMTITQKKLNKQCWQALLLILLQQVWNLAGWRCSPTPYACTVYNGTPPTPDPHLQSIYGPSKLTQIFKKTFYTHTVIQQILTHPKWFYI